MSGTLPKQLPLSSILTVCSIVMPLTVISSYLIFRHRFPLAKSRTTLLISPLIAFCDLIVAATNFAQLNVQEFSPTGCVVVGGFLYAIPFLISTFYACSVALNCLLVFVLHIHQRPWLTKLYIFGPPVAGLSIGCGALAGNIYGPDATYFGFCWYRTDRISRRLFLIRKLTTWILPLFLSHAFLSLSIIAILFTFFRERHYFPQSFNSTERSSMDPRSSHLTTASFSSPNTITTTSPTHLAAPYSFPPFNPVASRTSPFSSARNRRRHARHALVLRLLAYLFVAIVCIVPVPVFDILLYRGITIPPKVSTAAFALNSCFGLFNGIVYWIDPTVLAVARVMRAEGAWSKFWHKVWRIIIPGSQLRGRQGVAVAPTEVDPGLEGKAAVEGVEHPKHRLRSQSSNLGTIHFKETDGQGTRKDLDTMEQSRHSLSAAEPLITLPLLDPLNALIRDISDF